MKVVAANGVLVLVPCALVLHLLASRGSFGTAFYVIQATGPGGGVGPESL